MTVTPPATAIPVPKGSPPICPWWPDPQHGRPEWVRVDYAGNLRALVLLEAPDLWDWTVHGPGVEGLDGPSAQGKAKTAEAAMDAADRALSKGGAK